MLYMPVAWGQNTCFICTPSHTTKVALLKRRILFRLPLILLMFHAQVSRSVEFMQLPRVALDATLPVVQAFVQMCRSGQRESAQIGVDCQVVTYGVAFDCPTYTVQVLRGATGACADDAKTDLVAPTSGQVALHGQADHHAIALGIGPVQKATLLGRRKIVRHGKRWAVLLGPGDDEQFLQLAYNRSFNTQIRIAQGQGAA